MGSTNQIQEFGEDCGKRDLGKVGVGVNTIKIYCTRVRNSQRISNVFQIKVREEESLLCEEFAVCW